MKFVIVQVSRSYRLLVCGIIPILTIAVLAPTIDHDSVRGYVEVSFGVSLLSPVFVCMQEEECKTLGSSLLLHHYIRWYTLHSRF